uniref:Mitochondrial carrier protein n=1 Tax=Lotharella oceanica TaxID=641309 RepID=A0A7S2TWQ2_9EUKA
MAKSAIAPFMRIKLLFQVTDRPFSLESAWGLATGLVRDEGIMSLWRGNSAVLVRTMPYVSIHFLAHDIAEEALRERPGENLSAGRKFAAGAFAGVTGTVCTYPLDLIRARMAVGPVYTWTHLVKDIYGQWGISGFYRGLTVTLAGIVPYTGIAWTIKGKLNESLSGARKRKLTAVEKLACGSTAGLIAQAITYPLEMVRRRMQMPLNEKLGNDSVGGTLRTLVRTEGAQGLFKGFTLNVIKGPIAIGISFATFDTLKEWFTPKTTRR